VANGAAVPAGMGVSVTVPPAIANGVGNPPTNFPDTIATIPNFVRRAVIDQHTDQVFHHGALRE